MRPYLPSSASSHGVGVTYFELPASASVSLNGGINGVAASVPAGKVASRSTLPSYDHEPFVRANISVSKRGLWG
jgi:hypothetical protein